MIKMWFIMRTLLIAFQQLIFYRGKGVHDTVSKSDQWDTHCNDKIAVQQSWKIITNQQQSAKTKNVPNLTNI